MKFKVSLFILATALTTGMQAQNITNTLGSSGQYIVEDASNDPLMTISSSFGTPIVTIGDASALSPSRQFTIVQEGGTAGIELYSYLAGGFSSFNKFNMAHARGTAASPAVVHYEDQLGSLTWSARGTTSMNESARINVNVGESAQDASTAAVTTSYAPTHFSFAATDAAGTGTSDIFYINGDGTVQIPALTSVSDLQTDANGVLINGASDARLKSDVADLPYGLSEVMSLRPVTFTWNEKSNMEEGLQHGFIAQEVAEVFPELVGQRSDGYYTVSYKELVPALTAAIQEQQDIISEQDRKLQELEARLLALENPEVQEASISSLGILLIAMGGITVLFFAVFKVRRA